MSTCTGRRMLPNAEIAEGRKAQSDQRIGRDQRPKHRAPFTEQLCDIEFRVDRTNRAALIDERALRAGDLPLLVMPNRLVPRGSAR